MKLDEQFRYVEADTAYYTATPAERIGMALCASRLLDDTRKERDTATAELERIRREAHIDFVRRLAGIWNQMADELEKANTTATPADVRAVARAITKDLPPAGPEIAK